MKNKIENKLILIVEIHAKNNIDKIVTLTFIKLEKSFFEMEE
jgi:hypothetical protein